MTQPRRLKLPIPVTIITGSLGVGKTTAICALLQSKPRSDVWCIIVNEFGAVGLDAVAIEASCPDGSAVVKQLAGGCMCCVLSGPLSAAIAQIIRQAKPDRVLIEPSGLGHPGGLIDILQGPHLCTSLQLNAVICLVDLSLFDPAKLMANSIAADQVTVADVLVGSKADAAACSAVEAFKRWAADELFPRKQEAVISSHGQLDTCWLDAPRAAAAGALLVKSSSRSSRARQQQAVNNSSNSSSSSSSSMHEAQQQQQYPTTAAAVQEQSDAAAAAVFAVSPGKPCRVPGTGLQAAGCSSCGWLFDQQDMFDQVLLLQLLQQVQPHAMRLKGVFRVGKKQWVMPLSLVPRQQQQQQQLLQVQDEDAAPRQDEQQQQQKEENAAPGQDMLQQQQQQQQQQPRSTVNAGSESGQTGLQLQPVCYRGPSMVEVIVSTPAGTLAGTAGDAASAALGPLNALLAGFLQAREHQQSAAAVGVTLCDEAEKVALAQAGGGKMTLSCPGSKQLDSTWQLMEEALLACLQRR